MYDDLQKLEQHGQTVSADVIDNELEKHGQTTGADVMESEGELDTHTVTQTTPQGVDVPEKSKLASRLKRKCQKQVFSAVGI